MNKKEIKALTYGASIGAIYAILLIILRYSTPNDSLVSFIIPIPLAIYAYKYSLKDGLIALIAYTILSILITGDLIKSFLVSLPNLTIGLLLAVLIKNTNKKLAYLIVYLVTLILDVISTILIAKYYGFEIITDLDYMINFVTSFTNMSQSSAKELIYIIYPSVFTLYALVKTMFLVMFFKILSKRLKVIDETKSNHDFTFSPKIGVLAISILVITLISLIIMNSVNNLTVKVIFSIIFSIYVIVGMYVFFQGTIFLSIMIGPKYKIIKYILPILTIILFPITYIIGIVANFIIKKGKNKRTNLC